MARTPCWPLWTTAPSRGLALPEGLDLAGGEQARGLEQLGRPDHGGRAAARRLAVRIEQAGGRTRHGRTGADEDTERNVASALDQPVRSRATGPCRRASRGRAAWPHHTRGHAPLDGGRAAAARRGGRAASGTRPRAGGGSCSTGTPDRTYRRWSRRTTLALLGGAVEPNPPGLSSRRREE